MVKTETLKELLNRTRELEKKHSFIEWETIALNISAVINSLPICHNQDDRGTSDVISLICPNMFLIGRNNSRSPAGFVEVEGNPITALNDIRETNEGLLNLLGEFVHRFIPGKKVIKSVPPLVGDIVLFTSKEAERSRNIQFKYGLVEETEVHGRPNKIRIKYRNPGETIFREAERSIQNVTLIIGINDVDFNTSEHYIVAALQRRHL